MSDVTKKSVKDLKKLVHDKQEELREFRFASAGSRTRNVRDGRNIRKLIAQARTELRKRALADSE